MNKLTCCSLSTFNLRVSTNLCQTIVSSPSGMNCSSSSSVIAFSRVRAAAEWALEEDGLAAKGLPPPSVSACVSAVILSCFWPLQLWEVKETKQNLETPTEPIGILTNDLIIFLIDFWNKRYPLINANYLVISIPYCIYQLSHLIALLSLYLIIIIIIYMKKLLDSDRSRSVQLLSNSMQKCVIPCNFNLKH